MRPPLRVEAKVAEELRNWLTSELERLDAANTNQFAHHVVTILLQEDLDIDDEPLSTDDCFDQWGIKTVKLSKTRDKQIKAAVQFLRSAIASEESIVESEIEIIVNELVIRIEATKQRLNHRKSRGRDLLGALTINTENTVQENVSTDPREGERSYNEVFPSLPGETHTKVHSAPFVSPNNSVWNKSPPGKENSHQAKVRRLPQTSVRKVKFADRGEAEACSIAARVIAMSLPDDYLPNPEAMEISLSRSFAIGSTHHAHPFHPDPFDSCWKSAFCAFKATSKPFSPSTGSLPSLPEIKPNIRPSQVEPVVIIQKSSPENPQFSRDLFKLVNLLDPEAQKIFFPAENVFPSYKPSSVLYNLDSMDSDDLEVIQIFQTGRREQQVNRSTRRPRPLSENLAALGHTDEIRGMLTFPSHFGNFWNDLASRGALCMYPKLGSDPHRLARSEDSECSNLLGAVGSNIPNDKESDGESSSTTAWASVTFTSDLYSFAIEKLADLGLNCEDGKEGAGAACASGTNGNQWREIRNFLSSAECGPFRPEQSSRGIIASSDSGILLHAAADRGSSSPLSEPSLSAPAAFQLPHVGWPLERPKAYGKDDLQVSNRADVRKRLSNDDSSSESDITACSRVDFPHSADQNALVWPEPPQVSDNHTTVEENSHSSVRDGLRASAMWSSPLGESSWDHIQKSIFPAQRNVSDFTLLFPAHDSSSAGHFLSPTVGNFSSILSMPPALVPLPLSSDSVAFASSSTSVLSSDRSGCWPSPPASHTQVISESQPAGYFSVHSIATHFMPSELSSGLGMESTVAHVLQSAYVNSIFNKTPSEPASVLKTSSNAVNCVDLEKSWFSSAADCPNQAPRTRPAHDNNVVKGRTCSKWLENDCDRGSACPFSHPSLRKCII